MSTDQITFDEACRLIGLFLNQFALLEEALDDGVAILLGVESGTKDIVSSVLPFTRKVDFFFAAEKEQGAKPDRARQALLKSTKSMVLALNDHRKLAAHLRFDPVDDGLVLRRAVTSSGGFSVKQVIWPKRFVEDRCSEMTKAATAIKDLAIDMKRFEPSLDFNDSRNSCYAAVIL